MKDFLIEIGVEEIPARLLDSIVSGLRRNFCDWMVDQNIDPEFPETDSRVQVSGTPRRLLIRLKTPEFQADKKRLKKGPPSHVAYTESGEPSAALQGFCRQSGLDPEDIAVENIDGGEYVVARWTESGMPVETVLQNSFEALLFGLEPGRQMRWEKRQTRFVRPLRWLLAFADGEPFELTAGPLLSKPLSHGLRFTGRETFEPAGPDDYFAALRAEKIIVDSRDRRKKISDSAGRLAAAESGEPLFKPGLLAEVANLVEAPVPFIGGFENRYLELPDPVLIETMVSHQKYIPVVEPSTGDLKPFFIGVRNGGETGIDLVRRGNQRVLRARLEDAVFFYEHDLKVDFEKFREQLKGVVFQEELGSLYDKTERLESVVLALDGPPDSLVRAARHCKNDRVTEVVGEFPELQGVIGRIYAKKSGWPNSESRVVEEHYRPTSSGSRGPSSAGGSWLALLDRIDTLAGLFALGERPTGSTDPYGLRRDARAVLRIIIETGLELDLRELLEVVGAVYREQDIQISRSAFKELLEFIRDRFYQFLRYDEGFEESEVNAVLNLYASSPLAAHRRLGWLREWQNSPEQFEELLTAAQRVINITPDDLEISAPRPQLFEMAEEVELWERFGKVKPQLVKAVEVGEPRAVLEQLRRFKRPVDSYFDEVMVNCEDEAVRANRLATLVALEKLFELVADFSAF